MSGLGLSVRIGGKCQDWGSLIGGEWSGLGISARIGSQIGKIVLGLRAYCQDCGHKTPNSHALPILSKYKLGINPPILYMSWDI